MRVKQGLVVSTIFDDMAEKVLWYSDLGKCGSVSMDVWEERINKMIARNGTNVSDEKDTNLLDSGVFWVEAYGLIAPVLHAFIARFDDQNFVGNEGERLDFFTTEKWGLGWREKVLVRENLAKPGFRLGKYRFGKTPLVERIERWSEYLGKKYSRERAESQRVLATRVARVITGPQALLPYGLKLGETVYIVLRKDENG